MKKHLIPTLSIFIIIISFNSCSLLPFLHHSVEYFRDNPEFKWITDTSKHFQYYFEKDTRVVKDIQKFKKDAETDFLHCLKVMGEKEYNKKLHYFVVKDSRRMKLFSGIKPNALSYTNSNIICSNDSARAFGCHEMTHILTYNLWGSPDDRWLSEGFAVLADNNWGGYNLHAITKYIYQKGKWIPLKELTSRFNSYSGMINYPEAGSLVKYIYEKYGPEKAKKFWEDGISETERILGISIETLEKEWMTEIQKSDTSGIDYPI
jgi:hypothetical protein